MRNTARRGPGELADKSPARRVEALVQALAVGTDSLGAALAGFTMHAPRLRHVQARLGGELSGTEWQALAADLKASIEQLRGLNRKINSDLGEIRARARDFHVSSPL